MTQEWQPKTYDTHARFVSDLGNDIFGWLAPQKGERILDVGCGDGALTLKLVDAGAHVVGVDASADMVAGARVLGIDAYVQDCQALTFSEEFDAVFSNAALHWMPDYDGVIAGVARALKPQRRFVAEFGGHGNVAAICTALRAVAHIYGVDEKLAGGWFYPTPEFYQSRLEAHGFRVERIALVPRPVILPTDMAGWLMTFRKMFFDAISETQRAEALDLLLSLLKPALQREDGKWTADYVRLKVCAVKQ